jgi:membrane fusion protein, multidrug efflux system
MTPFSLQRPRLFVAVATAAVLAAACGKPETREAPVRAVQLLTVSYEADAGDVAVYAGEVRARTESLLGFRVAGTLQSRPVAMGQRVAAGDVLATLDARDYQLGAAAADAQRAAADSQWQLAKADLARFSDLADKGFIGQAQLQRYQAAFDAAQAQATSANAGAAAQRNQLDYTVLRATHPGVITATDAQIGQVVPAGMVVVRLAHDGAREVQFAVPQQRLRQVAVGQSVSISSMALADEVKATVVEVAASADPITRTYLVRVSLPAQAQWPLGSTVQVRLAAPASATVGTNFDAAADASVNASVNATSSAIARLPSTAVWLDGDASSVWVLDTNTMQVVATPVRVVKVVDDGLLVAGLRAGQEVVSVGGHALTPQQVVKRLSN